MKSLLNPKVPQIDKQAFDADEETDVDDIVAETTANEEYQKRKNNEREFIEAIRSIPGYVGEINKQRFFALRRALGAKKCHKLMSHHLKSPKSVTDCF